MGSLMKTVLLMMKLAQEELDRSHRMMQSAGSPKEAVPTPLVMNSHASSPSTTKGRDPLTDALCSIGSTMMFLSGDAQSGTSQQSSLEQTSTTLKKTLDYTASILSWQ